MTNDAISNLIKEKEEQIKKLQYEIDGLKQKLANENKEEKKFSLKQKIEINLKIKKLKVPKKGQTSPLKKISQKNLRNCIGILID